MAVHPGSWQPISPQAAYSSGSYFPAGGGGYQSHMLYDQLPGSDAFASQQVPRPHTPGQSFPTQTQTHYGSQGASAFATRYYDSQFDDGNTRSAMISASHNGAPLHGAAGHYAREEAETNFQDGASANGEARAIAGGKDHHKAGGCKCNFSVWRWWLCALAVAVLAVLALCSALLVLLSDEFQTFSALAWEGWFTSFPVIMIVLASLALCALVASILGICLGCRESKVLLRAFSVAAACTGCILLCGAGLAWVYNLQARPFVFRAANLICQDERTWNCKGAAVTQADWQTSVPTASSRLLLPAAEVPQGPLITSASPATPSRRLGPAATVIAWDEGLDHTVDANKSSESCRTVQKLCEPPQNFSSLKACVCSGQWRKARPNATEEAPGPWQGSEGAYCHAWGSEAGEPEGPWCFVSLQQECSNRALGDYRDAQGNVFGISEMPCSAGVESRSQMMLDAVSALNRALQLASLLGIACLLMACCGFVPALQPKPTKSEKSKRVVQETSKDSRSDVHLAEPEEKQPLSLEDRFEEAQRMAVQNLSDATPEEVKLMLYGYYKQAREGDASGERPSFFSRRDRQKFDAWDRCRGMSTQEAIESYIQAVSRI
eukprot:CAMPEP_0172817600 /NCGR_PEP_ID=MMETSP1075-20121228/13320_1 /TAXON_ID=2916 /ORGANISM="Ceratium fusus, Strain PA161109" /LENGTH=605 /DNA_ID=CAMNT_0013657829 /DNA_START=65 /DNA_END=1882 /DNA_ORIENTATION=-